MRLADKEITERAGVEAVLQEAEVVHLAMVSPEGPYVVPLSFAYRDGALWAHCATEGRKLDVLREAPQVCFSVVAHAELARGEGRPCTWTTYYRSVIGTGRAAIITAGPELRKGLAVLVERFGGDPAQLPQDPKRVAVIRVDVDTLVGKSSEG